MNPLSGLSRRALVAVAALAAVAPDASARKRKQPPLAFVKMTLTGVSAGVNGADRFFTWSFSAGLHHPDSGFHKDYAGTTGTGAMQTETQTRAAIVSNIQFFASNDLSAAGHDVPADRISVVLL
jgi:hypothetical protein